MPNVSMLHAEILEEQEKLIEQVRDLRRPKSIRENALRLLRKLERQYALDELPGINHVR